jgi:hypothetical protein
MADSSHLREIERIVQESVFHPSPCRRLRERVIQNAVQARLRHNLWKRLLFGGAALSCGVLLVAGVVIFAHRPHVPSASAEVGPVRVQIYSPGRVHEAASDEVPPRRDSQASLGEALYFQDAGNGHASATRQPGDEKPAPRQSGGF